MDGIISSVLMMAVGIAVTVIVGKSTNRMLARFMKETGEPTKKSIDQIMGAVEQIRGAVDRIPAEMRGLQAPIRDLSSAVLTTSGTVSQLVSTLLKEKGK